MRKIRERRHHTGSRRYLVNERTFAGAGRLSGRPFDDAGGDAAGGSEKDLSGKTRGHHKESNYGLKINREEGGAPKTRQRMCEYNQEERDEWRSVLEVKVTIGGAQGK